LSDIGGKHGALLSFPTLLSVPHGASRTQTSPRPPRKAQQDRQEDTKTYEYIEIDEPVREDIPPQEMARKTELAAERLMERFHMDRNLRDQMRHRVEDYEIRKLHIATPHWAV